MLESKTIWLAVNAASGSNTDTAVATLEQAFGDAACVIARRIGFHEEGAPTLDELRKEGVDVLAIFTGDGTANSIVTALYGWEGVVLVLPGGTMNILAQRLHGDAEPDEIIARIAADRARRVRPTVVRSRHGDGLSGILAGPGTAWAEVREALRETDVIATIKGAAEAVGVSTAGPRVFCRKPGGGAPKAIPRSRSRRPPTGLRSRVIMRKQSPTMRSRAWRSCGAISARGRTTNSAITSRCGSPVRKGKKWDC